MATAHVIRVLIVEDSPMVREGLRSFLDFYPDIEVVGDVSSGEEAISSVARLQADVVVMDINLPRMDGIATTREIRSRYPHVAVLGLSIASEEYVSYSMQKAGACGVLTKGTEGMDGLYQAIKMAAGSIGPPTIAGNDSPTISLLTHSEIK